MSTYIQYNDIRTEITASANWQFPNSELASEEVVRGYDGKLYLKSKEPIKPERSLDEVKQDKLAEISAAYERVLAYIISPESSGEIAAALAVADFSADDPEGLAFIRAQLKARRTALEAAVAASFDTAAVQAIVVSFNV